MRYRVPEQELEKMLEVMEGHDKNCWEELYPIIRDDICNRHYVSEVEFLSELLRYKRERYE